MNFCSSLKSHASFCCKTMSDHELVSTASSAVPRRNALRLRLLLFLSLPLIIAAIAYTRYDVSRPAQGKREAGKAEARKQGNKEANNDRFEFDRKEKSQKTNRPRAIRLGWFFDIYIQVSNTTFRVESEIRPEQSGQENFSYHKFPLGLKQLRRIRLIKLQRAHDGCLGANRRRRT